MSYAAHHKDFAGYVIALPSERAAPARGLLRRALDSMLASRQRHAEKELAGFISRSGGHLTDDVERRMMARLTSSSFSANQ